MAATNGKATRQYSQQDYTDFAHAGPGTLAGEYLRRFWHPVCLARDLLPGRAKPIRIMNEDFTLYRGEGGAPHTVAFRCAHRGTQLSTGWVEGDCIRCFYHGWKYDGSGHCVEQPAEDAGFASKVKIESYPTEEYLGLIFAYLGDAERGDTGAFRPPPLPRFPDFEGEGVLIAAAYTWPCNFFNNLENGPDEVHVCFVHRSTSLEAIAEVPQITAEETEYGLVQYGTRSDGEVRVTPFLMPNILQFKTPADVPEFGWLDVLGWRVPIDDTHHTGFRVFFAHLTGELARRYLADQEQRRARLAALPPGYQVAEAVLRGDLRMQDLGDRPDIVQIQDHVSQCGQGAIADRVNERLGRSDVGVILLRKIWARELQALAEGRPLKQWRRAADVIATAGI